MQLLLHAFRAFTIAFIYNKYVGDFHQTGLHVLDVIAQAGNDYDDHAVGQPHDINFVLTHADGFDQYAAFARSVQQQCHFRRAARQSAQKSTCGHGANEYSRISGMALHANAVAQNRTARIGAGGVHSDHAHGFVLFPVMSGQPIYQRALAGAGSARDSH